MDKFGKQRRRILRGALTSGCVLAMPSLLVGCGRDEETPSGPETTAEGGSAEQLVDDGLITAKIKAKLLEDPVTKGLQINVDTFKGQVQLSGFVSSSSEKVRAEELAGSVDGVESVANNLQVKTEEGTGPEQFIDDRVIAANVKAKLLEDPVTKGLQINIDTFKGQVQLNGFVRSREERIRAEELAGSVEGVESVINNLEVK